MSNKNVKYWDHNTLEWKNTGTHTVIEEKDYSGIVWKNKYTKKGRPEDTRAIQRLGQWLGSHNKRCKSENHKGEWKLSKVAQEFTQRGWTLAEVEQDINTLVKDLKERNKKASVRMKELLHKNNRSFIPSEKMNLEPLEDSKVYKWLDDWE